MPRALFFVCQRILHVHKQTEQTYFDIHCLDGSYQTQPDFDHNEDIYKVQF